MTNHESFTIKDNDELYNKLIADAKRDFILRSEVNRKLRVFTETILFVFNSLFYLFIAISLSIVFSFGLFLSYFTDSIVENHIISLMILCLSAVLISSGIFWYAYFKEYE